jgi:hypothetical protein
MIAFEQSVQSVTLCYTITFEQSVQSVTLCYMIAFEQSVHSVTFIFFFSQCGRLILRCSVCDTVQSVKLVAACLILRRGGTRFPGVIS